MSLLRFFSVRKRIPGEDLSEESTIKRTKNNNDEPTGEESSTEDNSESEPKSSTVTTATDTSTTETSSGSKQAIKFSKKWLKGREHWLEYLQGQGMLCKLCRKYNQHSFGHDIWNQTPCRRLRLQSIVSHENSSAHMESVRLELRFRSQNIAHLTNPVIPKRGIEQAFSSLYFLAKQRIPHTTNFEPLLDFLELLGVSVKSDIQIARNATYTSMRSIQEMLFILSEIIET